jgi:hypothetical protein
VNDDGPGRRALEVLLLPVLVLAVLGIWPSRVPDLRRLARAGDFRQLQSGAALWVDRHFERVDADTPWLDRAGRWVWDRCETRLQPRQLFNFPPGPPSVWCRRDVTGVYGADGNLPDILAELRVALGRAGWAIEDHRVDFGMSLWKPVMWPFHPSGDALGPPAGQESLTSEELNLGVGWTSRGQLPEVETHEETMRRGNPRIATAIYQPVEVEGAGVDHLVGLALARHQHAIAIRIGILYYYNGNANAKPGRLPTRLRPVWR